MTALALLQQFHELGVVMTPSPDGMVRYRALKGVLTPALLDGMRQHKAALLALAERLRESAPSGAARAGTTVPDETDSLGAPSQPYIVARCGEVGKWYRADGQATYHAIRAPGMPTVAALNSWHLLPFDFPLGGEDYQPVSALCGAQLRRDRNACWVEGKTVTCKRCATHLYERKT